MFDEACALIARDGPDLRRKLAGLLGQPALRRRMGEAALGYAARQGESLSAALDDLTPLLPSPAGKDAA
jgi:hypothetical protein